jgi:type IV secretory pathway TraG/TraD family ATPase VirD4
MRFRVAALWIIGIVFSTVILAAPPAFAEVTQQIIERIATLNVELDQIRHLNRIAKLSNQDYNARTIALHAQINALWQPYLRGPNAIEDQNRGRAAIDGLTKAKLAVLIPQWQKEENDFRTANADHQKQLAAEVQDDARRAAEFQRTRLNLQKQLTGGTIDRAAFDAKDREALAGIAALRKKFEAAGGMWPQNFDNRMALLTKAIAESPDRPLPQSQVPVAGAGPPSSVPAAAPAQAPLASAAPESPPDFNADVKLAASIAVKQQELHFQFEKKQIANDAFVANDIVYGRDLSRLKMRYQAISIAREQEFESAYRRLAEPQMQALRVQYYPERYRPPSPVPVTQPRPDSGSGGAITLVVIVLLLIGGVIYLIIRRRKPPASPVPPLTENYGSAAWAAHRLQPFSFADILLGVTFGKSSQPDLAPNAPGAPITSMPETHTLIVARTRAGKGTRIIVPTLLRYTGSMLVIDPKGENAAITARTRRDQLHHTVHIVNPWGEMEDLYRKLGFAPATFNPLDAIDRNDPNAVAFAQSLAAIICPPASGKEQFWQGSAANVLAAVFLWLAETPGEQKTLARARQIVTLSRADFRTILVRMMASTAYRGAISEMVSQYVDLAPETYSAIMANLAENTKFLSDPRIKDSTASSSFSLKTLLDKFTTVYIVVPHDRILTHATWLRLVIAAAMQGIKSRDKRVKPHHRCMFLIDEFGSIGHIADIPRDIALMSGYGLDFTLIVQGLDQLKDHYGEARGTILSNCAFKWFCFVNEIETAKYLSESLGKATVRTVGKSLSSGQNPGGSSEGENTTYGEVGRSLLTPDEILNLGREAAILLNPRGLPFYLRPVDYWNLPDSFAHLQEEFGQFYWDPPLAYDDNPYFKGPSPRLGDGMMSREEALKVLGFVQLERADNGAIATRYEAMMRHLQPGDEHLGRKINAAKEVLLGK